MSRESRYSICALRRKNATCRTDGERKQASIRKARRSLVDSFTQECQVAIERAIVERTQFHLDGGGITRDRAGKLEEREQAPPSRMSIRGGKILVTGPHRQIRQSYFADCHH